MFYSIFWLFQGQCAIIYFPEEEKLVATLPEAGGDGVDVSSKTKIESPEKVAELLDAVVTAQLAEAEIIA